MSLYKIYFILILKNIKSLEIKIVFFRITFITFMEQLILHLLLNNN